MSTIATQIRDAAYERAIKVIPAGFDAWGLTRKVQSPTLNTTDLPLLQVVLNREGMHPDGDANVGAIRFVNSAEIAITVLRGLDDPAVLDGAADSDLDNILDALLQDNSFSNPPKDSPWYFEGVERIENTHRFVQAATTETYLFELSLRMTFTFRTLFAPPDPNWLEEISVELSGQQQGSALFEVGKINYTITGPTSAPVGTPAPFTLTLEPGATFSGLQSIQMTDGGAGGIFLSTAGNIVLEASGIVVLPSNGIRSFPFTYTAASAGAAILSFANGQNWNDPAPRSFVAF